MPIPHLLLALMVVVIWGCNFIFIKFGLVEFPPLLLCALRFFLSCFPAIFWIKRPAIPFKYVITYGMLMFAIQFTLLFLGIYAGMTAGLASLLIQVQVFFSLIFATFFFGERPAIWQVLGAIVSFSGIALVMLHTDKNISLTGVMLILAASASWGMGNLITKKINQINKINMLSLVVWGSFVACIPLTLLSFLFEGGSAILHRVQHVSYLGIISVLYIVYASTWIGYGIWNWLLSRYPVTTVTPFTLMVPVVGMMSSILVFHEPFQTWKLVAGLLVIFGLCVNLFGIGIGVQKSLKSV